MDNKAELNSAEIEFTENLSVLQMQLN